MNLDRFHRAGGFASAITIVAILYLTLMPNPLPAEDLPEFDGADKLCHALMFGFLTFIIIFDRRLMRGRWPRSGTAAVIALIATLFGGVIEILQGGMDIGRSADVFDFLFDGIGAGVCLLVYAIIRRRHAHRLRSCS